MQFHLLGLLPAPSHDRAGFLHLEQPMKDIAPIFLIEGWDGIRREGDGFAIGAGSGD